MNKKIKLFVTLILVMVFGLFLTACGSEKEKTYSIVFFGDTASEIEVGETNIDFTKYFIIVDNEGNRVTVTSDMLDLTNVDLTKTGKFTIKAEYEGASCIGEFEVIEKKDNPPTLISIAITGSKNLKVDDTLQLDFTTNPSDKKAEIIDNATWTSDNETVLTVSNSGLVTAKAVGSAKVTLTCEEKTSTVTINVTAKAEVSDLSSVFNQYNSYDDWNFVVDFAVTGEEEWNYFYSFDGINFKFSYDYEGVMYDDYVIYNPDTEMYYYYYINDDNVYEVYDETTEDFEELYYNVDYLELMNLNDFQFSLDSDHYVAIDPNSVGNHIFGEYDNSVWTYLYLYIENNRIVKIIADSDYTEEGTVYKYHYTIQFSGYNTISIDPSKLTTGGSDDSGTGNTSEFTNDKLATSADSIAYSASRTAYGFDGIRGVQFVQSGGEVKISSNNSIEGVKSIKLVVATNSDAGMQISVSVGNVALKNNGSTKAEVGSTGSSTTEVTFTSTDSLSGIICITLTPNGNKKSMYIKSITVSGDDISQGDSGSVMTKQNFDESTLSKDLLQDKLKETDGCFGLSATGEYPCLVVPVQFSNTTISQADLTKLNKAFNGTETDTGWESVASYYKKSSYDKLKLSFDIQNVYISKNPSTYYQSYERSVDFGDGEVGTETGEQVLLLEVLTYLEPLIDLSKYDYDKDGVIDAVYLIYSNEVEYDGDGFWWAYTTFYAAPENENKMFDNLDAYYYLFAGFDFMDEDTENGFEEYGKMAGLKINASTFIHETGHLLGLDDYYDYEAKMGCNEGLGGSDMMDSTVGDHCSYSKIMLGWVKPEVVTSTKTVTINNFVSSGDCIMLLLDYNNSYFCEYLLIDLYSNQGLNNLHSKQTDSYLYDAAEFGVRVYHISSKITNPYSDSDYPSLTDYNNSTTSIPLIKLVEADGEKKFLSSDGYAMASDLWETGDDFSTEYSTYKRNNGDKVNFNIIFTSVTNNSATISIVFVE